jgi:mono/diheme cytochrome c family protein
MMRFDLLQRARRFDSDTHPRGQFMQNVKFAAFFTAALALIAMPGSPVHAADAAHGRALAQRWCAACHVVSADQKQASADAPPFITIARSPISAQALAYFLLDPHPVMPTLPLSRNAADDIAAYIKSLK